MSRVSSSGCHVREYEGAEHKRADVGDRDGYSNPCVAKLGVRGAIRHISVLHFEKQNSRGFTDRSYIMKV